MKRNVKVTAKMTLL